MRLIITEKQLKKIISKETDNQEIGEQEDPAAAQPSAGTSATQSGGQGYPEVSKWSDIVGSKLARGPANPIGNGKMTDRTKRDGPANQIN
jgi:hypothetical protein